MHKEHIVRMLRQHKYNSYKGQIGKIAPNLLQRDFSTTKPNEKWVADVTQFNLFGTKLYLSPILDLYDQSLISWNLADNPITHRQLICWKKHLNRFRKNKFASPF